MGNRSLSVLTESGPRAILLALALLVAVSAPNPLAGQTKVSAPYFGVHILDEQTGRGVPLVELRTVNQMPFVSDSGGWVAFHEPELMDREVFFFVAAPGYELAADGFGFRGVTLRTQTGSSAEIRVRRTQIAERMYRITGEGIHRDSTLLGLPVPHGGKPTNVLTLGQDSVQAVPYRGKIFWLWGDTNLARYPLGNFHTTAATSPLPGVDGFDPSQGIPLTYFCDETGQRVAEMAPDDQPGAVWLFGLLNVAGPSGAETLIAHYSRHLSLAEVAEHGLVQFNDQQKVFDKIAQFDLAETWRYPRGNAVRVEDADGSFYYFCGPFAQTRVAARWESVIDPKQYEAMRFDESAGEYVWQKDRPPTTQSEEREWVRVGKLKQDHARYQIGDAATGKPVDIHRASIAWSPFWKKWLLVGNQVGGREAPSYLGEMWLSVADHPTGPWRTATKIATHPKYSFYNPRQHTFLDAEEGRYIFLEGTFTQTFSSAPYAVPRYDYNQILYRVDLSDKRLKGLIGSELLKQ